ncbi:hypothetical protein ACLOJK_025733 [Asimina triloba]
MASTTDYVQMSSIRLAPSLLLIFTGQHPLKHSPPACLFINTGRVILHALIKKRDSGNLNRSIKMKGLFVSHHYLLLLSIFFLVFVVADVRGVKDEKIYVVYMGAATFSGPALTQNHIQLLSSVLQRDVGHAEKSMIHSYKHGFSGFAARMSAAQARALARRRGVVSVFEDPILQLHTTRSWDFLKYQTDLETDSYGNRGSSDSTQESGSGVDTIIGLLDTGVWPESASFDDTGMGPIPGRWKGVCVKGVDFNSSNCNRKLIGARYYTSSDGKSSGDKPHDDETPRDSQGHGTHTSSTAAGASVADASYYGIATGTAKGGSPGSRIAMYRVCFLGGCRGSAILAAYDDAINDGVDVLSLSLGASPFFRPGLETDPIAIGAFHAVERGILVVCSAGNNGPDLKTVVNEAPWILTVAASTIDRDLDSSVLLGSNELVKGEAINFSNLGKSPVYTLVYGGSAKSSSSTEDDASNCNPDSLDAAKVEGTIVFCEHSDNTYSTREKRDEVKKLGAVGLILMDDTAKLVASKYGNYPTTVVSSEGAAQIKAYMNSTKLYVCLKKAGGDDSTNCSRDKFQTCPYRGLLLLSRPFQPDKKYSKGKQAGFSTEDGLPDIAAPGVNILAAWIETNNTSDVPPGKKPSLFNLLSGTSMACPHVSGIAATIKSKNPTWGPSAIRSAIMTTAILTNNEKAPLTQDSGSPATPYDYGAGEVTPSGGLQPGLVYEMETNDYLLFLCYYGYDLSQIKKIANVSNGFSCPKDSSQDMISNLNYPSISISKFDGKTSRTVNRTVTNVGPDQSTYVASVKSPSGLAVKVVPDKLQFTKNSKKMSYQVVFSSSNSTSIADDLFGWISWTDGTHKIRSLFAVTNA